VSFATFHFPALRIQRKKAIFYPFAGLYPGEPFLKRAFFAAVPITLILLFVHGRAQDLLPPLEWGQFGFSMGYQLQKGAGQYLTGKDRYALDSLASNPVGQSIPMHFRFGCFPGTEMFFELPVEFRNKDYGDANGLGPLGFGLKTAFPQLLGFGGLIAVQFPQVTGSLDKIYPSYVKELQYGAFFHRRWTYFQLTSLITQSHHPGGFHHPSAANGLRIEAKPEAIWFGKYLAYWSVHYQNWNHVSSDSIFTATPKRFLLYTSPGIGFQLQNDFRWEVTYLFPVDGKNMVVFHGVEAKIFYTLPWRLPD
jgi:hypothetical protein